MHDDKEMICSTATWPAWPCLPLKCKDDIGVLFDSREHNDAVKGKPGSKFTIYLVCLFDLPDDLVNAKKIQYDSVDELLKDGWWVD